MIKNKKGFISISIVYSFFIVFMLLLVLIMTTYVTNRVQSTIYKNDIKKQKVTNDDYFIDYLIYINSENDSFNEISVNGFNTGFRYQGSNVNNYLLFNRELWRIIGVIPDNYSNYYVKIIRVNPIENIMYDYKSGADQVFIGTSVDENGSNDWSDSQLMMLLNPEAYLNAGFNWNGIESHNYYFFENYVNANGKIIFRNMGSYMDNKGVYFPDMVSSSKDYDGILQSYDIHKISPDSKRCIAEVNWNLGSISNTLIPDNFFEEERGNTSAYDPSRAVMWTGYAGLIFPSDYYLAENDGNWLEYINDTYTISAYRDSSSKIVTIESDGTFSVSEPNKSKNIYPVLNLRNSVIILSGDGTIDNPYKVGDGYEIPK